MFVRHATEMRILLRSDRERLYDSGIDLAAQHAELAQLLSDGNEDLAEAAFRMHVEEARDRLAKLLSNPTGKKARRAAKMR